VSFSNLLELVLDLPNSEVLRVFDFLEGVTDLVELGWVDSRGGQNLVNLSIFSLVCLEDRFNFLLQDQVAETSLSVHLIDKSVEFVVKLLLLTFQVLHLLQLDFVLPFHVANASLDVFDLRLAVFELILNFVVAGLAHQKLLDQFVKHLKWDHYGSILFFHKHLLALSLLVLGVGISQIILKLLDDVHVCVGDLRVVLLDISILLLVFLGQSANRLILLTFDPLDLGFTLLFFVLAQQQHLVFEASLNLVGDTFVLLADVSVLLIVSLGQRVEVLSVSHLLLLLRDFQGPDVLLQLAFSDPMLILNILESDLGVLLELRQLVLILENQMLKSLLVNFDLNLVLLLEVLVLALFVTKLGLLILQLLLANEPEVVDPQSFVVVEADEIFFFFDELLEVTRLNSQSLLELVVINIVNGVGTGFGLLLG